MAESMWCVKLENTSEGTKSPSGFKSHPPHHVEVFSLNYLMQPKMK